MNNNDLIEAVSHLLVLHLDRARNDFKKQFRLFEITEDEVLIAAEQNATMHSHEYHNLLVLKKFYNL